MSSDITVSVRQLGKLYHIYDKPQDRMKQSFLRKRKQLYRGFWALRNVSFELRRGEAVGIIGRNGAGKSTLLQIIAGILTPTEGEVLVNGRVAALLELGSGFNPLFSGRENVFISGSIRGIPRQEMEKRFDDIAGFADIGDFIDQPVKTYSSGMFARLAFATAIHISTSIFIIDEILAVGDVGFQRKCLRRLEEMLEEGTSILFVTHSADVVRKLCSNALYLERGNQKFFGPSKEACDLYLDDIIGERVPAVIGTGQTNNKSQGLQKEADGSREKPRVSIYQYCTRCGRCRPFPVTDLTGPAFQDNGDVKLVCVKLFSEGPDNTKIVPKGTIEIRSRFVFTAGVKDFIYGVLIRNRIGQDVFGVSKNSADMGLQRDIEAGEEIEIAAQICCNIRPENYFVTLGIQDKDFSEVLFYGQDVLKFEVLRPSEEDPKMIGGLADLPHKLTIESLVEKKIEK